MMNSKERAFLRSKANGIDAIINIGKDGVTPDVVDAVDEALEARELIKISVLKNCLDDKREIAETVAARTRSEVVQVMGRKITLYRWSKKNQYGI